MFSYIKIFKYDICSMAALLVGRVGGHVFVVNQLPGTGGRVETSALLQIFV